MTSESVRLRPATLDDVGWMSEMACDPDLVGVHNWGGEPRDRAVVEQELTAKIHGDTLVGSVSGTLIVELADGTPIGDVSWRTERWGPSARSSCPAIGITLLPPFRGRGHGTAAQALLVDHLFNIDPELHRVQSDTAADNIAEQHAPSRRSAWCTRAPSATPNTATVGSTTTSCTACSARSGTSVARSAEPGVLHHDRSDRAVLDLERDEVAADHDPRVLVGVLRHRSEVGVAQVEHDAGAFDRVERRAHTEALGRLHGRLGRRREVTREPQRRR